jgi:hypothetical protein
MKQSNRSSYPLQHSIRLILLGLCVIFTTILWFELNPGHSNTVEIDLINIDSPPKDLDVDLKEIVFPDITAFDEIIERPLFNETRLPSEAQKQEQTVVNSRKKNNQTRNIQEQISLSAVVITQDTQIAILQKGREKALQRVSMGETIDGWTLEDVSSHSIRLVKGNETKNLELEIKNSAINKSQVAKSEKDRQSERQMKRRSRSTEEQTTAKNTEAKTAKKEK